MAPLVRNPAFRAISPGGAAIPSGPTPGCQTWDGCVDANVAAAVRFRTVRAAMLLPVEAANAATRLGGRPARDFAPEKMFGGSVASASTGLRFLPTAMTAWRTLAAVAVHRLRRTAGTSPLRRPLAPAS